MTTYTPAPEVAHIAGDLIATVEDHEHLQGIDVIYVWRDQAAKSKGKKVLGKARKVTGLNAFLARDQGDDSPIFVVEIAEDIWIELTTKQRYALVDHELSHFTVNYDDDEPKLGIKGHDVEEFRSVIDRHGLWMPDVADFAISASEQMRLAVDGLNMDQGDDE